MTPVHRDFGRPAVTFWQLLGRALDLLLAAIAIIIAMPIAFGLAPPFDRRTLTVIALVVLAGWLLSPRPTWRDLWFEWRLRRRRGG